jgi:beta-lactamase regulating signal transducer with metallopeptidase domain
MNFITNLNQIAEGFLTSYAWPVFWQTALLVVIITVAARTLFRRASPQFRYLLWLLVLVRLVLPPAAYLPTGIGNWGRALLDLLPAPVRQEQMASQSGRVSPVPMFFQVPNATISEYESPPKDFAAASTSPAAASLNKPALLLLAWVAGIAGLFSFLLVRLIRFQWLLRGAALPDEALSRSVADYARRLGMLPHVKVRVADTPYGPIVCGFLRPVIVLPKRILLELSQEELAPVLIHELAHVKRGDWLVNWLQVLSGILYFFHPFLWYANRQIRQEREKACDDLVLVTLGLNRKGYVNSLMRVRDRVISRMGLLPALVGIVEHRSNLSARILRILDPRTRPSAKLSFPSVLTLIAFACCFLTFTAKAQVSGQENPTNSAESQPPSAESQPASGETRDAAPAPLVPGDKKSSLQGGGTLPSMEEIRSTTAKRIKNSRAWRLRFEGQEVHAKEYISWLTGKPAPSQDIVFPVKGEITMGGGSYREDVQTSLLNSDTGKVLECNSAYVSHSGVGKGLTYLPTLKGSASGRILKGESSQLGTQYGRLLSLAFRPDALASRPDALAVRPDTSYLAGDTTAVLRREMTKEGERIVVGNTDFATTQLKGATRSETYLDPSREYLPTRMVAMYPDGRVATFITMEYSTLAPSGFVPAKATHSTMNVNEGKIGMNFEIKVTKLEVDPPIDPSIFTLTFPPGTRVYDNTTKIEYVIPSSGEGEAPAGLGSGPAPAGPALPPAARGTGESSVQEGGTLPSIEEIRSITAKRITGIKTLKFSFEGQLTYLKEKSFVLETGKPYPPKDVALPINGCIVISGSSYRQDVVKNLLMEGDSIVVRNNTATCVSHEGKGKLLEGYEMGKGSLNGMIFKGDGVSQAAPITYPLVHPFLPMAEYLAGEAMAVLRRETTSEGERIVAGNTDFDNPKVGGATRREVYLDPTREYLPSRWVAMYPDGRVSHVMTMEYSVLQGVHVPAKATLTVLRKGEISITTEVKVTKVEVGQPVDTSTFTLSFPPGTGVTDTITGVSYTVGGEAAVGGGASNVKTNEDSQSVTMGTVHLQSPHFDLYGDSQRTDPKSGTTTVLGDPVRVSFKGSTASKGNTATCKKVEYEKDANTGAQTLALIGNPVLVTFSSDEQVSELTAEQCTFTLPVNENEKMDFRTQGKTTMEILLHTVTFRKVPGGGEPEDPATLDSFFKEITRNLRTRLHDATGAQKTVRERRRISVDLQARTITVTDTPKNLRAANDYLKSLPQLEARHREIIALKYLAASEETLAEIEKALGMKPGSIQTSESGGASGASEEGKGEPVRKEDQGAPFSISRVRLSNSIVVTYSDFRDLARVKEVIAKLDRPEVQVEVETLILEVDAKAPVEVRREMEKYLTTDSKIRAAIRSSSSKTSGTLGTTDSKIRAAIRSSSSKTSGTLVTPDSKIRAAIQSSSSKTSSTLGESAPPAATFLHFWESTDPKLREWEKNGYLNVRSGPHVLVADQQHAAFKIAEKPSLQPAASSLEEKPSPGDDTAPKTTPKALLSLEFRPEVQADKRILFQDVKLKPGSEDAYTAEFKSPVLMDETQFVVLGLLRPQADEPPSCYVLMKAQLIE